MGKLNDNGVIIELLTLIKAGTKYTQAWELNETRWKLSKSTFVRRWNLALKEHTKTQEAVKQAIADVEVAGAVDAVKLAIMTANERKEYLTQLIRGEVKVPYTEVRWDKHQNKFVTIKFEELPTPQSRIAAIAELNRMEGDYAPTKIAPTDAQGNDRPTFDYSRLSTEELVLLKQIHEKAKVDG